MFMVSFAIVYLFACLGMAPEVGSPSPHANCLLKNPVDSRQALSFQLGFLLFMLSHSYWLPWVTEWKVIRQPRLLLN